MCLKGAGQHVSPIGKPVAAYGYNVSDRGSEEFLHGALRAQRRNPRPLQQQDSTDTRKEPKTSRQQPTATTKRR